MPQAINKVLVTGSNGQVGCLLSQKLERLKDEFKLYSFDREALDITSQDDVVKKIDDIQPDIIINCAAHTGVDKAETDIENSFAINELGPKYLAEQALKNDALLIHISTDYVFDGNKTEPYNETDKPNPKGVYGKSKLAGELAIQNTGCKNVILRTSWVFGEHGNNFVKTMLKLGKTKEKLGVIGDQFGGPTYAGDIADAIIIISKKYQIREQSGVYHYSGHPHVSWYELACEIFNVATKIDDNYKAPQVIKIRSIEYPLPAVRPANSRLNCNKLYKNFNISESDWNKQLNENLEGFFK
ncbi:dTDP-4-dehydrorhamnose reductase [Opacimonas viscosa]|uniref:dTDP-4-dehydrorhamnose reductase n=1 Tax=Opacimonas viscosa TaxID=2961944 RepID=A0AA42BMY6_9ALTE|nr:dTDP-4-dehydrorhamnose reductase [Opacimonas viscosa]MCP3429112.1 dTDP-4-dehydrorhamnose reductase [Opacimonas viscosa]